MKEALPSSLEAMGSSSVAVPSNSAAAKAEKTVLAGRRARCREGRDGVRTEDPVEGIRTMRNVTPESSG